MDSTHPKASWPNILGKMPGKSWRITSTQTNTCEEVMRAPAAGSERNGQRAGQTFMRQKVRSLWQSEVQTILIRTSSALGGSTTISSTASGSPAALHTAAARRKTGQRRRAATRETHGEDRNRRGRARDRTRLLRTFASDGLGALLVLHVRRARRARVVGWNY